jgi:hypothetical protein
MYVCVCVCVCVRVCVCFGFSNKSRHDGRDGMARARVVQWPRDETRIRCSVICKTWFLPNLNVSFPSQQPRLGYVRGRWLPFSRDGTIRGGHGRRRWAGTPGAGRRDGVEAAPAADGSTAIRVTQSCGRITRSQTVPAWPTAGCWSGLRFGDASRVCGRLIGVYATQ